MMMVRSYLGPSTIEGLGVFSHTDIRKGQLIWLYDPGFDVSFMVSDIERAPKHFREFMDRYTYPHPEDAERVVLDCDEGRFMNHSDDPAMDLSNPSRGVATRDIPAGTEITCDYGQFVHGPLEMQPPRHRVAPIAASVAAE
jgi:SET domain-containing protein